MDLAALSKEEHLRFIGALRRAVTVAETPFILASGATSSIKVDIDQVITKRGMRQYLADAILRSGPLGPSDVDAVGGPAIGAIPLACGLADLLAADWFYLDKMGGLVAAPEAGTRVLLVDDVITSGGSLLRVADALHGRGVTIVGATTLLDRSTVARAQFESRGIAYWSVATFVDLGLEPVVIGGAATALAGTQVSGDHDLSPSQGR